jgi:geranylgeranyl diphosphate synthase, type I
MRLEEFRELTRPYIEDELKRTVLEEKDPKYNGLYSMMAYHLGWEGEGAGEKAQGKRIRPLLALLGADAAGKNWKDALPAAAAVELIHNFSLIHDDIEDRSEYRHGRKTVWEMQGEAQAINTGDCMFSLAFTALNRSTGDAANVLRAFDLLQSTCVQLTKGQYLDMAYESADTLPVDAYWPMVGGKTASLLACSTAIGATLTGADKQAIEALHGFAWNLGLAFQAQDDWLGIWGDSAQTGKSADSDLMSGKKSLPVLLGLNKSEKFRESWQKRPFNFEESTRMAGVLIDDGIQALVEEETSRLTKLAKVSLKTMPEMNPSNATLLELAEVLLKRTK